MREKKANKSYSGRLTKWIDILLPIHFTIDHLQGSEIGLMGYVSRPPQQIVAILK